VRSIEFVIRVGAGTEAVGLFESIHLFVYKLMLKCYQWSQTKGPFVLRTKWLTLSTSVVTLFNKINITIVIFS
jgi:hypothetical protein